MLDNDDGYDNNIGNHYANRVTLLSLSSLIWREEERIEAMSMDAMMQRRMEEDRMMAMHMGMSGCMGMTMQTR
jgi:hypothetical protein